MEGGTFLEKPLQKEFGRFVEIVLHTDGKDAKYGPSSRRNKILQQERFGTVALPYYVVLDPTGEKVYWKGAGVIGLEKFLAGLKTAP